MRSLSISWAKCSRSLWITYQPSPRATNRRMAGALVPPMMIGTRGCWAGRGSICQSCQSTNWPLKLTVSPVQAAVMASMYSSPRGPRSWNGTPRALNSSSSQPTPRPSMRRPPDRWSIELACLARYNGFVWDRMLIPVPKRMVDVAAAAQVMATSGSTKAAELDTASFPDGL